MGRPVSRAWVPALVLAMLAAVVVAATGGAASAGADGYHVVVFKDPPAAVAATEPGERFDPQSRQAQAHVAHLNGVHGDYVRWLSRQAPEAEVVRDLVLAANALAVDLNGADPAILNRGPGVKYTTPSTLYRPSMTDSVDLVDAWAAWTAVGGREGAGAGIDVGIIDTGIFADHPFFDEACVDEGFPAGASAKVIDGGVFYSGETGVADDLFGGGDDIVFDHGTHVAGTVGGCVYDLPNSEPIDDDDDTISGVAPGVTLWDYNVFPGFGAGFVAFGGSAFSHDIAAAIEQALADGIDVINMSLGGGVQGPHDFLAEAVDAASAGGLISVVAAGNSGDTGTGDATVESPGSALSALTVGATTNSHVLGLPVTVEGFTDPLVGAVGDFGDFHTDPGEQHDGPVTNEPLSWWGDFGSDPLACSPIGNEVAGVAGTVALIQRGTCTFSQKVANAEQAGAIAVVVYNNVAGPPTAMGASSGFDVTISATMISKSDGEAVLAALDALEDGDELEVSIVGPAQELAAQPDILAGFSSRGPAPFTHHLKPDLVAPGVNIYSSIFTVEEGVKVAAWEPFQGTSMATPHVAGAVALLLAGDPELTLEQVRSALVNRAARVVTDPGGEDPAGALMRGGGRLDIGASFGADEFVVPALVSFGHVNGNKTVSISRMVEMTDGCSFAGITGDNDVVTATVDGGSVTAVFSAGRDVASGDYEGDLVFDCDGDELLAPWWARVDRRGSG